MVASIKPHRDQLGLGDELMLIGGRWTAAAGEATWSHDEDEAVRLANDTEYGLASPSSPTELKTVLLPFTGEMM